MRGKGIAVDRKYYLKGLYTPLIRMFLPIVIQLRAALEKDIDPKTTLAEAERVLFGITKQRPWRHDAALRGACMANSPLVMAFKRQRERAESSADGGGAATKKPK